MALGRWDDCSGNGRHATQTTAAKRPALRLGVLNGKPVVRFDGVDDALGVPSINLSATTGVTVYAVMSCASGGDRVIYEFSDNYNRYTDSFLLYRARTNGVRAAVRGNTSDYTEWESAGTVSDKATFQIVSGRFDMYLQRHETTTFVGGNTRGFWSFLTMKVTWRINDGVFGSRPSFVGARAATSEFLAGDLAELLVYATAHSPGQRQTVEQYLATKWGISGWTAPTSALVFEGDSMTEAEPYFNRAYPIQLMDRLGSAHQWLIPAVSGQTVLQMITDAGTQIFPLFSPNVPRNVCVFWGGTNDLKFGATRSTTLARITDYSGQLRAAGFYVVLLTMLPRSDAAGGVPPTFEADRQSINESLRANWPGYADAFVDVAADTRIGDPSAPLNPTYYAPDRVHLTPAGLTIITDMVQPAMAAAGVT